MFAVGIEHHKQFLPNIVLSSNFWFSDKMPSVYLIIPNNGCLDFWLLNNNDFIFVLTERRSQPKTL